MKSLTLYFNPRTQDIVTITKMRRNIRFGVGVADCNGFSFVISKDKLMEMIK
jgi:hypothetical protein